MSKHVFFSTNDFTQTSGGTIRMYGILNSMAANGQKVVFISNAQSKSDFHPAIEHIYLNYPVNAYSKRKFQLFLAHLPLSLFNYYYRKFLKKCKAALLAYQDEEVIFFEYLDNSIGYWLTKNEVISGYVNDIHGIATEEFKFQLQQEKNLKEKGKLKLKILTAQRLDRMVFSAAKSIIVPTSAMGKYFQNKYRALTAEKVIVLPNVLQTYVPPEMVNEMNHPAIGEKFNFLDENKVVMFAGGFKKSSGVLDLIKAFSQVHAEFPETRLLLIGDGPLMQDSKKLTKLLSLEDKVFFTGRTAHNQLHTFQQAAHILVCPDEDNLFSRLIIHYKYLEALLANKVVINGNFESVLEINPNEKLSLGFTPSDVNDLARVIAKAVRNYPFYQQKYHNTREFVLNEMTYKEQTNVLTDGKKS